MEMYFLENNTGDLWLYDESAGSLTETNDDFNSSSNTDGAGCGIGLSGGNEFVQHFLLLKVHVVTATKL